MAPLFKQGDRIEFTFGRNYGKTGTVLSVHESTSTRHVKHRGHVEVSEVNKKHVRYLVKSDESGRQGWYTHMEIRLKRSSSIGGGLTDF